MSERPTVFLHIGAPKSGTTYLQTILFNNRAALRADGLLYPGAASTSHFWASQDLRGMAFKRHVEPWVPGAWHRLVDELRAWPGSSVIDHEMLAAATEAQVDRALADLEFADVHVVWTSRDIARQLPAAWQERLKNRSTLTYASFLDSVEAGLTSHSPKRAFWPQQDAPEILARWSRTLPPERVHVGTIPPPGADPSLLWRRFAGVLGIDPDAYDTNVGTSNPSLTAAEAAVLRRLNESLEGVDVPWPVYRATIKHGLVGALGEHPGPRIELPDRAYKWAGQWSRHALAELREAGYRVVGDLRELVPSDRPTGENPDQVPAEHGAEAATRMLGAMFDLLGKAPAAVPSLVLPSRSAPPEERVDAAVTGMVGLVSLATKEYLAPARRLTRAARGVVARVGPRR
ncbi:MAG TPA: hypothetical protein VHS54_13055 [Jatrophihabitans sp.]|nr:hypothetical protein [Jatrophihabitans sp.]